VLWAFGGPVSAASAQGSTLSWTRGEGAGECIGPEELQTAVLAALPATVTDTHRHIDARIDPMEGGWRLTVAVRTDLGVVLGTRTLERPEGPCRELDEAIVFLLVLAHAEGEESSPAPTIDEAHPSEALINTSPVTRDVGAQAREEPGSGFVLTPSVGAGLAASVGTVPGLAMGVSLELSLDLGDHGTVFVKPTLWAATEAEGAGGRAELSMLSADVGGCWLPIRTTVFGGGLCALIGIGHVEAQGHDFLVDLDAGRWLVGLGTLAVVRVNLARAWFLELDLGATFSLLRPKFHAARSDGSETVLHRPSAIAATTGLRVMFRFE